ncbi:MULTISPECIES: spore protease YyaC [Paenibacillus]|uniref:Sporulation protein n=1 Tax=Paenibacillus naphthalenovorans TaxID=162209 RepID=A0A0U2ING6_9BACL|nr:MULTISPECIES: spore protease YyaC [Paenibacillus]ALS24587.1 sporulation protein [Paenibacillus naphthalenovorans]NTZ16049.1 spore protease YyaC [Paenibacillus sp. JMULE4]GCL74672.1 spore protease YyaC [Paenibacillus naphthalenovorans]
MKIPFHRDAQKTTNNEILKVMHSESNSIELLSERLFAFLQQVPPHQPIVLVCVGTDRSTGDSLGPLVGTQLKKYAIEGLHLFGTLDHPVHAMNLSETLTTINQHFNNPYIIAVDACLGQLTSVGCIQIGQGPVKPGAGVNKELPPVGNMHITGIVNVGGFMEYFVLQNTRLSLVMNMSDIIAKSFYTALTSKLRWKPTPLVRID